MRQQFRGSFNRPCYQLRKEADETKEFNDVIRGRDLFPIHVYGITDGLKSIEAETNRNNDLPHGVTAFLKIERKQGREAVQKKMKIFKGDQNTDVPDDAGPEV